MENPFELISAQLELITEMLQKLLLKEDPVVKNSEKEYLNIKEVGDLIFLSTPTIYGLVSKREIPHVKRGKRLYFSRTELVEWLKKGKRRTNEEIKIEVEKHVLKGRRKK